MIFVDKPFHIGDWIEADAVVGTVEEVGFRSTRIRAADTSIFQIPNSKLAEIVINNKGLRLYRRYKTNLGFCERHQRNCYCPSRNTYRIV